jgi:hypothetical protein
MLATGLTNTYATQYSEFSVVFFLSSLYSPTIPTTPELEKNPGDDKLSADTVSPTWLPARLPTNRPTQCPDQVLRAMKSDR